MAAKSIAKKLPRSVSDKGDVEIYEDLKRAPALLTEEVVGKIDEDATATGPSRRIALWTLAKPGQFVVDSVMHDHATAVAFADSMYCIRSSLESMRKLTELMQAAELRIMVALCGRDDMESVLAEAQAGKSSGRISHAR